MASILVISTATNLSCGSPTCKPKSCTNLGASCGQVADGCGGTLECGSCAAPQVCGGSGTANVCGTGPCGPKTCGAQCGQVSDGCGAVLECGGCKAPETCGGGGANLCGIPSPVVVAPKLDPTVATDIATSTAFLYSGDHPIQTGVAAGTIEPRRVAIIRGTVEGRDGQPMAGVKVIVLSHPEYGSTLTRADGVFDLAVNGGGFLTVNYEKTGFLTSHRQVQTPWRDFVWAPKVTLVPIDPNVTKLDLAAPGLQVARGSVVTDEDGTRQARIVVKPGTTAELVVGGKSQPVTS